MTARLTSLPMYALAISFILPSTMLLISSGVNVLVSPLYVTAQHRVLQVQDIVTRESHNMQLSWQGEGLLA